MLELLSENLFGALLAAYVVVFLLVCLGLVWNLLTPPEREPDPRSER